MVAPRLLSATPVSGSESQIDLLFDQAMRQDAAFFSTANFSVSDHTVTGVSAPATNTARITVSPGMVLGASLTATVVATLENVLNEAMDGAYLSVSFTGVGIPPVVSSVAATSNTTVRVTFNEAMTDNDALRATGNYLLTPDLGIALTVAAVNPEPVANPTYVDLVVNEMTDGDTYQLRMSDAAGDVLDAVGNALDLLDAANTQTFTGQGSEPSLISATVIAANTIRLTFDEGMRRDSILASPSSYMFTAITAGATPLYFEEVTVPASPANPTYVDIVVSEMTDGASYEVAVLGPTDPALNPMSGSNSAGFTGVGQTPTIDSVIAISANRVNVVFNEAMRPNADIIDPTRYTWTNGLETLSVLEVTADGVVKLVTTDQIPGVLYDLTVDPT